MTLAKTLILLTYVAVVVCVSTSTEEEDTLDCPASTEASSNAGRGRALIQESFQKRSIIDSQHNRFLRVSVLQGNTSNRPRVDWNTFCNDRDSCNERTWEIAMQDPADAREWSMLDTSASYNGLDQCMKLPSFFYIGVGHAGSTSLAEMLNDLPELSYGSKKEHDFISLDPARYNEYKNEFVVDCSQVRKTFDASPSYYEQSIGSATWPLKFKAIHGNDLKFLVFLRNPVDALYSQLYVQDPQEFDDLVDDVLNPTGSLNSLGPRFWRENYCYVDWLAKWQHVFHPDQFLVVISEEFFANPTDTFEQVLTFLGLSPQQPPSSSSKNSGRRRLAHHPSQKAREKLLSDPHMKDCTSRLAHFLGRELNWGF